MGQPFCFCGNPIRDLATRQFRTLPGFLTPINDPASIAIFSSQTDLVAQLICPPVDSFFTLKHMLTSK